MMSERAIADMSVYAHGPRKKAGLAARLSSSRRSDVSEVVAQARIVESAIDTKGRNTQRRADDVGAVGQLGRAEDTPGLGTLVGQVVGAQGDGPVLLPAIAELDVRDGGGGDFMQIVGA